MTHPFNYKAMREANRMTPSRRYAEALGWAFGPAEVVQETGGGLHLRGTFRCVCGRSEEYAIRYSRTQMSAMRKTPGGNRFDPVRWLRFVAQAFSQDHLREDGYTGPEIADILERGKAFEAEPT